MRIYENGGYRDMTPEEMTNMEKQARVASIEEKRRPLTADEVTAMLISAQVNVLTVGDETALRMKAFYPEWAEDTEYTVGYKVQRNSKLWRCVTAHTSITTWEPENAHSLWETINENHSGAIGDPIPYDGNMVLEKGEHYIQNSVIYLCTTDTVNPVYHALADLVGLYVEVV